MPIARRRHAHHWFLQEWSAMFGRKQADAVRDLDWPKAKASDLWTGKQRYTQDLIEEVSAWLNIRPYELLMHPDDAMAIRRLRETAITIASISEPEFAESEPARARRNHRK
jgi:hypothetical protein